MEFFNLASIWACLILLLILFVIQHSRKNKPIYRILACGPKDKYTYIVQKKGIFFWKNQKCVIQSVLVDAHFDNMDAVKKFIDEQEKSKN